MRRVKYKENVLVTPEPGARPYWELQDKGEASFHQFGLDYEEFETGGCSFSIAILELDSGQVISVRADNIVFLNANDKSTK